ncbi:thioredoxin family protein [Parafilimonas sp.]|uniref:thioredoxin family protein n=1 Tax=Parafilimonas sp. TaxID=1969739 RepID=UPI0039E46264
MRSVLPYIFPVVFCTSLAGYMLPAVNAGSLKNTAANETATGKKDAGIQFIEQDWDKALKTARDQNKLVFLDIYATWCGPCKMLKQYTFTDAKVGEFFNKNFVNVSVDGEKGVGPGLAEKYAIEGYPTLIVADTTGKPVLITAGYLPSDVLMNFASEALKRSGKQPAQ